MENSILEPKSKSTKSIRNTHNKNTKK